MAATTQDPLAAFDAAVAQPAPAPAADPLAAFDAAVAPPADLAHDSGLAAFDAATSGPATPGTTQPPTTETSEGAGTQLVHGATNAIAKTFDPSGALGWLPK